MFSQFSADFVLMLQFEYCLLFSQYNWEWRSSVSSSCSSLQYWAWCRSVSIVCSFPYRTGCDAARRLLFAHFPAKSVLMQQCVYCCSCFRQNLSWSAICMFSTFSEFRLDTMWVLLAHFPTHTEFVLMQQLVMFTRVSVECVLMQQCEYC